jgi:glycosyltransferase involved in cell wall biosynthesis
MNQQSVNALFEKHKACVLIPTYNNAGTLDLVLSSVLARTSHVIVVNDGSTDNTTEVLKEFPMVKAIGWAKNQGKGKALREGFRHAVACGYEYVISIDSDGQHFAKDLPRFLEKLETTGPALIIGARNMDQEDVPGKSSFGHKFSNFWFWVETGIQAPDTQSGYRLYPVHALRHTRYFTKKFEFEIEVIVRAAWHGIRIDSVPVSVYYPPSGERVTHFRPFRDFTRISILNTLLVLIAVLYINPRNFFRAIFHKETYAHLWHELMHHKEPRFVTISSVAFGVFMGILPIWGFQLMAAIAFAILFRLNKALVIIAANISIPPMIPLIIYASYQIGALWTGPDSIPVSLDKSMTLESIHVNFVQYLYGSVMLAVVAGAAAGMLTYLFLLIKGKKAAGTAS